MAFAPVMASRNITEKYQRYLRTIFRIEDEDYARQFEKALANENAFAAGPYLDVIDSFKKGASIAELCAAKKLASGFSRLNMPGTRALYLHQELAIEKACHGRNIVVSTGTGSGKTECFLIPIFDHLLREAERGSLSPGVRALIIYPMNALANDQMERLRGILADCPEITYGSYTGQTQHKYDNALAEYRLLNDNQMPRPNELISREQIIASPPHILITNYAMLEYLMIRPQDSVFFSQAYAGKWKFVVLDEAHVYHGSTGIEVSMLLRRLRAKLQNGKIQHILTSATLGSDEDNNEVAEFARNLCDSPFAGNDVIRAHRIAKEPEDLVTALPTQFFADIASLLDSGQPDERVVEVARTYADADASLPLSECLYQVLLRDQTYWRLRQCLKTPLTVSALARRLGWTQDEVASFVVVAACCEKNGHRLFDARYHMFLRATESVFITLKPSSKLFLTRKEMHYEADGSAYKVFEIATCSACHAIYLVGKDKRGILEQYDGGDDVHQKDVFLLADSVSDTDEDHSLEDEDIKAEEYDLCVKCGHLRKASLLGDHRCEHGQDSCVRIHKVKVSTSTGTLTKCVSCENVNSHGILRMFFTGQEAVTSVIGTALYGELPSYTVRQEISVEEDDGTGFGFSASAPRVVQESVAKQFIAFSDSRQAAAFYASYLDTSYRSLLYKRLVVAAMESVRPPGARSVDRLVEDLIYQFEQHRIADASSEQTKKEAWKAILDELVNNNGNTSLYGMGLLGLSVNGERIPANDNLHLTSEEVAAICSVFALGMMSDVALQYPASLTRADKDFFTHNGVEYSYTYSAADNRGYKRSFIPSSANKTNKRLDYLQRVLARKGQPVERERGVKLLKGIWDRILLKEGIVTTTDGAYRLDATQLKVTRPTKWYICSKCKKVTPHNVADVCPSYRCDGVLQLVYPEQYFADNHYFNLYRNMDIQQLRVVEHTAQLDRETAYDYQKQFQRKQIDVLSCSTTFEMGVDVGTLETVFMRNMPPSPANYAQRAGRAGRNKQSAAYAITFCNKGSHDFTFFRQPESMIRGRINPPRFLVENEKIAVRHLYASALGFFWARYPQYFSKAANMTEAQENEARGFDQFGAYLRDQPQDLRQFLARFLPRNLCDRFGVGSFSWVEGLLGEEGVFTKAVAEYEYEMGVLRDARDQAFRKGYGTDRLQARMRVYQNENILSFLSRKNVLPKYGFPVDTVEMQVNDRRERGKLGVQLQRDLAMAISEYAPGSQVVANGNLITSRYIRKIPRMSWKMYDYIQCDCTTLNIAPHVEPPAESLLVCCKQCGQSFEGKHPRTFLVPAFGFEADGGKIEKPGLKRPERTYRGETAYVGYRDNITMQTYQIGKGQIEIGLSQADEMAVLNDSNFFVCETCGFTDLDPDHYVFTKQMQHNNSAGYPCSNKKLSRFSLGYRFETDVILMRFAAPDLADWEQAMSLLYGLLRGVCHQLSIEENEIAGCLLYYPNPLTHQPNYSLVLFDKTPGGAGHVRRLNSPSALDGALRVTLDLMRRCDCGGERADSSCYACLRSYYNQKQHDKLKRGHVISFLNALFT